MDFLGVGPLEVVFIIVIALLVIGPRDMARSARTLGRYLNQMYRSETWRTLTEASRTLRGLPERLAREAALEELDETRKMVQDVETEIRSETKAASADLRAWTPEGQESASPAEPPDDAPGDSGSDSED